MKAWFIYADRAHVPSLMLKPENGSEVAYRLIADHLGSVRLVVRLQDGVVVQRIDYDEYGVVLSDSNPGFQPFGYAGGIDDREAGLVRFGARDYDPLTGRWLTKDPIGFGGGLNKFLYSNNDAVNFVDSDGQQSRPVTTLPMFSRPSTLPSNLPPEIAKQLGPRPSPSDWHETQESCPMGSGPRIKDPESCEDALKRCFEIVPGVMTSFGVCWSIYAGCILDKFNLG